MAKRWASIGHSSGLGTHRLPRRRLRSSRPGRRWRHISTHFIPGRNLTWFVVFLLAFAAYLAVVARFPAAADR